MEQQSKKTYRGNRGLSAGLPRYDACIALGAAFDKKNNGWQCQNVNGARAVAMLEIARKKKAPEPVPIGVNNRLKPLINLV